MPTILTKRPLNTKENSLLTYRATKANKNLVILIHFPTFYDNDTDTLTSPLGVSCHDGRKRHLRRPHFSKGLMKLAIVLDFKCPWMLCLALQAGQKFGSDFTILSGLKIEVTKKSF